MLTYDLIFYSKLYDIIINNHLKKDTNKGQEKYKLVKL